jgi:hypothetical protein
MRYILALIIALPLLMVLLRGLESTMESGSLKVI